MTMRSIYEMPSVASSSRVSRSVMPQNARSDCLPIVLIYAFCIGAWIANDYYVVRPLLNAEHASRAVTAAKQFLVSPPALFLKPDAPGRWQEYSHAMVIAVLLHLGLVLYVVRADRRSSPAAPGGVLSARRRVNIWLLSVALVFLVTTVVAGPIHDYYFYLQMWYEVRIGHDPWFLVAGLDGLVPLNAYGPLFNLMAAVAWCNLLLPKLLFASAYLFYTISEIKRFTTARSSSLGSVIVLTALFLNPYPWVEIAIRGHFDVVVALLCLAGLRARLQGRDVVAAMTLALGVLLKFFPIVLVPFLAVDGKRVRARFLLVAILSIALGLALSFNVWGISTFSPIFFAATRRSRPLSIFYFLRGRFSPLQWFTFVTSYDYLAPCFLVLALARVWVWALSRQPAVDAVAVVAAVTTLLFYQTGFPQYYMVPFVLGASWAVCHWDEIAGRWARVLGVAGYFGWLGVFDFYYAFIRDERDQFYWGIMRDLVGLPMFLAGCGFIVAVVLTTREPACAPETN